MASLVFVEYLFHVVKVMFLVIFSIPVYIFRLIVIQTAKHFRPDLGSILDGSSSHFVTDLFTKKPPRSDIIVVLTYSGNLSPVEIKRRLLQNWIQALDEESGEVLYPQFRQYPFKWMGFVFWKNDNNFQLDNHIYSYPNLGSDLVSEDELNHFVEKLLNEPHVPARSPWQVHIVQNYSNPKMSSEKMSTFILKVHHSFADGYSLQTALVTGITDQTINEIVLPKPKCPDELSLSQQFSHYARVPIRGLYEASNMLAKHFQETPWKVPNEEDMVWHQLYGKSDIIPIQKIKEIKNAFNVSFTSVLLSAISAGIYQNFEGKRRKGFKLVNDEHLVFSSVAPLPGHPKKLSNHVTLWVFDIPTGDYSHPVKRLQACDQIFESTRKTSVSNFLIRLYLYLSGWNLEAVGRLIKQNTQSLSSALTNFPAGSREFSISGRKCVMVDFSVGCTSDGIGVVFTAVTYKESIRFAVVAETSVLSGDEVNGLTKAIEREINLLHSFALSTSPKELND